MILYFGDPQGAHALLDRGLPVAGVVHGRRGGPGWGGLPRRLAGIPRWMRPELDDPEVVEAFAALKPSLIVASFFPERIPASVLAIAPGINVHPSPLPRWRGPDPHYWAIRSGDSSAALTVHWLVEALDAGDVLRQEPVEIGPRETAGRLSERLERRGAALNAEVAADLLAGVELEATPQDGEVTWAPLVDPEEVEIDWGASAEDVDRLVRAASPWPGAFTGFGDKLAVITMGRPADAGRFAVLAPGAPFVRGDRAFVRCGEGAYRIDRLKLGRRALTGRQLAYQLG